jgi:hypothetical protein
MPTTLKAVNAELAKRGHRALLVKGSGGNSGYFYFKGGEAADWLDRTVRTPKVTDLTLEQWVQEFERLRKLNAELLGGAAGAKRAAGTPSAKRKRAG